VVRRILEGLCLPLGLCQPREGSGCGVARGTDSVRLSERPPGMRPIGHPNFQYTPWSRERRAAASKAARERAKAASAKSVAKAQGKKAGPRSKPKAP
jgi:hypothetical protein